MTTLAGRTLAPHPPRSAMDGIYEKGRRCAEPDCITVLSIYNPGPKCWCHTRPGDGLGAALEDVAA